MTSRLLRPGQDPTHIVYLERYERAHAEMRAEAQLGAARAHLFIALGPVQLALVAMSRSATVAAVALVAAALASVCGVFVVTRSHERYVRTRMVLLERARALGAECDWQTTDGMQRRMPFSESVRVVDAARLLLAAYIVLDLAALALL